MTIDETPKTSAKLRADIDHGKGGDKVGFPDPAAAPLGTDAEAGGASPTKAEIQLAYHQEIEERPDGPTTAIEPRPVTSQESPHPMPRKWIVGAVLIAVILTGLLLVALR